MDKQLHYENIVLSYSVWGSGPKVLLAFHGFGQSKSAFKPFRINALNDYTIYSFDLFFHGDSKWDRQLPLLRKNFWAELQKKFFAHENIQRFSMIGYSMGGKFVLANLEAFPDKIDRILFVAPDGIKVNFWYNLATYPYWTRALFKKTVDTPIIFEKLVKIIRPVKLINKSLLKFAETQMDTKEKREKVYLSWVVFRALKFDMDKIAFLINSHDIQIEVFLGRFDKMIKEKHLKGLLKKVKNYKLNILQTGHNRLISEVADYLNNQNND